MTADILLHLLFGLLPVCCFLATLVYLDSYKLVPLKWVVGVIVAGCVVAVADRKENPAVRATGPRSSTCL